jgi:cytochrome c
MKYAILVLISCLIAGQAVADNNSGDAARGDHLFSTRCSMCHAFDSNSGAGPAVHGIFGRKAGTAAGYKYSDALKAANLTWNQTTLDQWLTDPAAMVPGTKMNFVVRSATDRADIIAYLKNISQK